MAAMETFGMKPSVVESIRHYAQLHGLDSVILFGSRANGSQRPKSDIDLALSGGDQTLFILDVEEFAPTLLAFDYVNLDGPVQQKLRERIAREGKVLYG